MAGEAVPDESSMPPASAEAGGARPLTRAGVIAEVTIVYAVAILLLRFLDANRGAPILRDYFAVLVPAVFLYLPIGVLILRKAPFEIMGFRVESWRKTLLYGLGMTALVLPLFVLGYKVYAQWFFHWRITFQWPKDAAETMLYQLLCVALPEELFYRGYMQSRLGQVFRQPKHWFLGAFGIAILISNFYFAIGHVLINFDFFRASTFIPGLLFAWLRFRTGSIYAGAFCHAMCNMTMIAIQGG
ncbi:MAG: CPBP family intramembrane metalloprotease [Myxococcales bacterium]|nr:CPBP family intramembrane metalloprotease [Myxococcales bacterium]